MPVVVVPLLLGAGEPGPIVCPDADPGHGHPDQARDTSNHTTNPSHVGDLHPQALFYGTLSPRRQLVRATVAAWKGECVKGVRVCVGMGGGSVGVS